MKKLCLGTLLHILSQAKISGTKQLSQYGDLLSCYKSSQDNFDDSYQGHLKSGKNNLTDSDNLISCDKEKLILHMRKKVIPYLKPALHKNVVLAIREVLKEDDVEETKNIGFADEGYTKQDIINKTYFTFDELLANVFYYCGVLVDNIPYKENIKEIKNDPTFVESFSDKVDEIEFEEAYHPLTSKIKMTLDVKKFNDVFKEIASSNLPVPNSNSVNIYSLDIVNAKIDYFKIKKFIFRNIGRYVYSRAARNNYELSGDAEAISAEAIKAYKKRMSRNPETNHFNEIMLYSFLECVLGAPKIFSKMELQNKSGEFNTFSSGIHVLSLKKGTLPFNQLILGATDTYDSLDKAVDNAFLQIEKLAASSSSEEYELLETTILNQEFDAETNELLKDMIIPKKGSGVTKPENAYGLFLGYTINIQDAHLLDNEQFIIAAKEKMDEDIKNIIPYINNKITALGLTNHSFYIYILPLNDALTDKEEIIKEALEV